MHGRFKAFLVFPCKSIGCMHTCVRDGWIDHESIRDWTYFTCKRNYETLFNQIGRPQGLRPQRGLRLPQSIHPSVWKNLPPLINRPTPSTTTRKKTGSILESIHSSMKYGLGSITKIIRREERACLRLAGLVTRIQSNSRPPLTTHPSQDNLT